MALIRETFVFDGRQVEVGVQPLSRATDSFYRQWEALESRSVEGNAYLSPHFIRPAIDHLDFRKRPLLLTVQTPDRPGETLAGLGVFIARPPRAIVQPEQIGVCQRCST